MTGNDGCTDPAGDAAAFVREDARRGAAAPNTQHAIAVPGFRWSQPPVGTRSGYEPKQQTPLEARPVVLTLRI
jgi:hypothetical protein